MDSNNTAGPGRLSSMEGRISIAGCLYWVGWFLYVIAKFYNTPGSYFLIFAVPFLVVFLLAAVGIWLKPKAGYITALAISAFSLFFVGPTFGLVDQPTLEGIFAGGGTSNAVLFLILFFSLFGARANWKKGPATIGRGSRFGRRAGVGAVVFLLLFVALGLLLGLNSQTGASNAGQASVVIEPGAAYITNPTFYSPATLHVTVGQTVVWKNLDGVAHTVTGDNGLGSGNMKPGDSYSFTFTKPGTYYYSCDYHTWMAGSIVVSG